MTQVVAEGDAVDENIVEEDDDKALKVRPEESVHCRQKRRGRIAEAKGHNHNNKVPVVRPARC